VSSEPHGISAHGNRVKIAARFWIAVIRRSRDRRVRRKGRICGLILICFFVGATACAQSSITLRIDTQNPGVPIPHDFAGLSFESSNLLRDKDSTYQFRAENKPLIALFRVIGIRSLRVGGGTADGPEFAVPGPEDVDHLFAFAKTADLKVIYTFRLLNGNPAQSADLARYIQQGYRQQLSCFEIGNEPDWHSFHTFPGHPRDPKIVESDPGVPGSAYPSYLAVWKQYAAAILKTVPDACLTGPDTGSNYPVPGAKNTDHNGESWSQHFAHDAKGMNVRFITHHDYPGQSATGVGVETALDAMLSSSWPAQRYSVLYDHVLARVEEEGFAYRMTECNDYTGGVDGVSNAFASALWALDYMHWQAAHHALGLNFHNKRWIYTDTVYQDASGAYHYNPKAYAIRAFDIGSGGNVVPLTMSNESGLNVTAYAVRGAGELFVTLINKEHAAGAREANITIVAPGITGRALGMALVAPNGDLGAKAGVTLGGAEIVNGSWEGKWTDLNECATGKTRVKVPAASAIVVRLPVNR
jgi:hypothetical protein